MHRFNYANEGTAGFATIFNEESSDWLDSNQCKDCFLPAFNYRPGGSAQYIAALRNFDDNDSIDRFRFGFIASSDNHKARPGTGYKEINRQEMTDANWTFRSYRGTYWASEKEMVCTPNQQLKIGPVKTLPSGPTEG